MATEQYSFFNSEGTDRRRYNAFHFAKYHADLYDSGVVHRHDTALKVTVKGGMTLAVADGSAFIDGYRYALEGGDKTLFVPLAAGTNRVDRVVLRLDLGARTIALVIVPGTASPPALTRTATVWELSLAQVTARAGVSVIAAADIVDERADNSLCGWARTSADPAFYPSDLLPELLWKYALFPNTLTVQEQATVETNPNLMGMFRASRALAAHNRATQAEALAGSLDNKWISPLTLAEVVATLVPATGSYAGTGGGATYYTPRTFTLGFTPIAVLISSEGSETGGIALEGVPFKYTWKDNNNQSHSVDAIKIETNGFVVSSIYNRSYERTYRYIAFR